MTALRFLGLIDSNGTPMSRLTQLVLARGSQRSEILQQISYSAYNFLVDKSLDPQVATYAQLEKTFYDAFEVTGDVARKCIKFFIELESDAGISLSPLIIRRSKTMRATSAKKKAVEKKDKRTGQNIPASQTARQVPEQITWYEMVLAKFPTFDPSWSDDVKLKWFEAFDLLIKRGPVSDTEKG